MKTYLQNNYGTCKLEKCKCLDPVKPRFGQWVGTLCPDWQPFTFIEKVDDLMNNAIHIRNVMEGKK